MPKQAFPVSLRSPTQDISPTKKSELSGSVTLIHLGWRLIVGPKTDLRRRQLSKSTMIWTLDIYVLYIYRHSTGQLDNFWTPSSPPEARITAVATATPPVCIGPRIHGSPWMHLSRINHQCMRFHDDRNTNLTFSHFHIRILLQPLSQGFLAKVTPASFHRAFRRWWAFLGLAYSYPWPRGVLQGPHVETALW